MPWRGQRNAEIYDEFTRERGLYRFLNRELVRRAGLKGARRVLDLACGTGATTRACLGELDPEGEIVGVDASADMVEVARQTMIDRRARFVVGEASELEKVVDGTFERVVCNAAFWQFPGPQRVLAGVTRLMSPGGRLVFNIPVSRIVGFTVHAQAFQAALTRVLVELRGQPMPPPSQIVDLDRLLGEAASQGLCKMAADEVVWRGRQGELVELMEIPALIGPLTADLSSAARQRVLETARAAVDLEEKVEVTWLYLVFERGA